MPSRRTPFRFKPSLLVATVGQTIPLLPLLRVRIVNGEDETVAGGFRFALESGSGNAKVNATTGKLTVRSTPGPITVKATHAVTGDICLLTVKAEAVSQGETDPEPEPEPIPEIPPPSPTFRRHFFGYGVKPENLGTMFTATMRSVSRDMLALLNVAAQRNCAVIGAQGSYSLYRAPDPALGGKLNWARDLYKQRVESHGAYADELVSAYRAGVLPYIQACDDFAGDRWKIGGLPVSELTWMAEIWHSVVPEIPLLLRARERQFTTDVPQGYFGMIIQHRYWGGLEAPAVFAPIEDALAKTRGHKVLWSSNYLHGGAIVNGDKKPMTPSQIAECGNAFLDVDPSNALGIGGWMDDPMLHTPPYEAVMMSIKERVLA